MQVTMQTCNANNNIMLIRQESVCVIMKVSKNTCTNKPVNFHVDYVQFVFISIQVCGVTDLSKINAKSSKRFTCGLIFDIIFYPARTAFVHVRCKSFIAE